MGAKEPAEPANVAATDHLVVYLDVSESMKGFVAERRATEAASVQTVFSKSLSGLRNVVTTLQPQSKVVLRLVDKEVHPPADVFQLAQYAINRDWFNRNETNLAGAINAFQEAVEEPSEQGALPARFHILVTDGVQSTKERRSDVRCLQGSDVDCVKEKINGLLSQGWGGTILGVRSDFNGQLFSETRPDWEFTYTTDPNDPESFRPFYLYIFSPDRAALEPLVRKVKEVLRPALKSPAHLREYPLTAAYVTGAAGGEIVATDKDLFTVSKEKTAPAGALCYNVDMEAATGRHAARGKAGETPAAEAPALQLTLRIPWSQSALDSGTPQEVAGLVRWELKAGRAASEKGARYPEMRIVSSTANPDGSVTLQMTAKWEERQGKRREQIYMLVGHLDLEKPAPPWVAQWSTDTDTSKEEAPRTLNLNASLANLWNNQFLQNQEIAAACLRVDDF
ncbi:MAG TPA: hypothetical protein VN256_06895 [Pyrinomonadaceae bacterium]|nr:hypothetical protein [Pyrinomonadaceae bacterium]